jgi:hypothetical protein
VPRELELDAFADAITHDEREEEVCTLQNSRDTLNPIHPVQSSISSCGCGMRTRYHLHHVLPNFWTFQPTPCATHGQNSWMPSQVNTPCP